jgi:GntR family transcriptional regulator
LTALVPPLHATLRACLEAEIASGRLAPGARLPSEAELVRAHGVSRITVRRALADLGRAGLVTPVQGKGSFVAMAPVAMDLSGLKGLGESLSGAGRTVSTRVLSLKRVAATQAVAADLQVARHTAVVELRTVRFLDDEALVTSRSWFPAAIGDRLSRASLATRDVLSICESDLGIAVGRARVSIGGGLADAARARLLGAETGAALVRVRRVVADVAGRPIQVESSDYRADRFSLNLTLERHAGSGLTPVLR